MQNIIVTTNEQGQDKEPNLRLNLVPVPVKEPLLQVPVPGEDPGPVKDVEVSLLGLQRNIIILYIINICFYSGTQECVLARKEGV